MSFFAFSAVYAFNHIMNPVVGIGELLWDIYPDGRKVIGGAPFNFAFHCHRLGQEAVIVSRIGDDEHGRELREEVKRLGMSDEFIQTDYEHPTGTVRVMLDDEGVPSFQILCNEVAWDHIEGNDAFLAGQFQNLRAIHFSTLAQRFLPPDNAIQQFVTLANRKPDTIRLFDFNLRGGYFGGRIIRPSLRKANWVKLSIDEMKILIPMCSWDAIPEQTAPKEFYQLLCSTEVYPPMMIVTKGAMGVSVINHESEFQLPAAPANVLDTAGAGDAFTAAMVVMHLEGKPLKECARFASHYAAKVCEHRGATPIIDRSEIEKVVFR